MRTFNCFDETILVMPRLIAERGDDVLLVHGYVDDAFTKNRRISHAWLEFNDEVFVTEQPSFPNGVWTTKENYYSQLNPSDMLKYTMFDIFRFGFARFGAPWELPRHPDEGTADPHTLRERQK